MLDSRWSLGRLLASASVTTLPALCYITKSKPDATPLQLQQSLLVFEGIFGESGSVSKRPPAVIFTKFGRV